jgi:hypothetical protein
MKGKLVTVTTYLLSPLTGAFYMNVKAGIPVHFLAATYLSVSSDILMLRNKIFPINHTVLKKLN